MTETLFINTNDKNAVKFSARPSFFSVGYQVEPRLAAKALAVQSLIDGATAMLRVLSERRIDDATATRYLEELWHVTEATVRRLDGGSAGPTQPAKDTEAPTSAPSDDSSSPKASRSSTKRKAIQSS